MSDFKSKKILIVEDNELNQKILQMIIKQIGHEALQVLDGKVAFEVAKKEKPDVILMDIQLVEISGTQVANQIRKDQELEHIPIIAVTAFTDEQDKKRIMGEFNFDDYITKPFTPASISQIVAKYIPIKPLNWV